MPYLTYDEYIGFGNETIELEKFNKLLVKASDVLDYVTRNFYQFNDLETDHEFRKIKFKKAVSAQIAFFYDMGGTSTHDLNEPSHVQIGRTSTSTGARNSSNQDEQKNNIVSDDVYMHLTGTGLLYRGLDVV